MRDAERRSLAVKLRLPHFGAGLRSDARPLAIHNSNRAASANPDDTRRDAVTGHPGLRMGKQRTKIRRLSI
jgi:hypothetical protein